MGLSVGGGFTDNQALHAIRDMLSESKKQTNYMLWLTAAVLGATIIQAVVAVLIYQGR